MTIPARRVSELAEVVVLHVGRSWCCFKPSVVQDVLRDIIMIVKQTVVSLVITTATDVAQVSLYIGRPFVVLCAQRGGGGDVRL